MPTTGPQAGAPAWSDRLSRKLDSLATAANIEAIRESCVTHVISHGAIGKIWTIFFVGMGFGAFFGLFMASMSTSAPEYTLQLPPQQLETAKPTTNALPTQSTQSIGSGKPAATTPPLLNGWNGMSARQQFKLVASDMASRTWSSAKNFGLIAALYSGSECVIEGVRDVIVYATTMCV